MANRILVVPADALRNSMPHRAHPGSAWADISAEVAKAIGHEHDEHVIRFPPGEHWQYAEAGTGGECS